jgi:predicted PurR-regulated permease PerM
MGEVDATWHRATQVAILGIFVLAIGWFLYAARNVMLPLALAWAVATIVLPIVMGLHRLYVPRTIAAVLVTLLLLGAMALLIVLLSAPAMYWLGRASQIGALLREKLDSLSQPLAFLEELRRGVNLIGTGEPQPLKVEAQSSSMLATIASVVSPAIAQFALFTGSLVFYLIYQERARRALVLLMPGREARLTTLRTLNDIDASMTRYFGTFTLVNVALGFVVAGLTWVTGLPNPLLWGVMAALLNYIPYLGPAIVTATLFVVGLLVHPSLAEAVVPPLLFLSVVTLEGQFITPALMGRRLDLNPFAIFLAVAFCAWLWGPLGAFLAVPLFIVLSLSIGHAFFEEENSNLHR